MRLGINPVVFLVRLLFFFFLTYVLWKPIEPAYTHLMATLTGRFLHLTETPNVTRMQVRETSAGRPAIFYQHARYPQIQSGIPAEWVQANMVLLIPLMLATPARSYAQRFRRLGLALAIALVLQVLDITVTVKSLYASYLGGSSDLTRRLYQFGDAFVQSMDTQLFPFAIWAGVHFNQLLGRTQSQPVPASGARQPAAAHGPSRKRKSQKTGAKKR